MKAFTFTFNDLLNDSTEFNYNELLLMFLPKSMLNEDCIEICQSWISSFTDNFISASVRCIIVLNVLFVYSKVDFIQEIIKFILVVSLETTSES